MKNRDFKKRLGKAVKVKLFFINFVKLDGAQQSVV